MNKTLKKTLLVGAAAAVVGCEPNKSDPNAFFGPENETNRVFRVADAQADAGARQDATLQPYHFTGGRLNSLGAEKLARMVPTDPQDEVTVYLNLPDADTTAARKDAVGTYFSACGVDAARLKLKLGPNLDLTTPAAIGLAGLAKQQQATIGEAGGSGTEAADQAQTMK